MADQFGLLPSGFRPMKQQDIISDLTAAIQASFGQAANTSDESVFGQLIGIMSERYALLWSLGQAIYANTYPSGATGVSVDNLLALQNLTRLPASPTVTNPSVVVQGDGVTLYGQLFYGTAGTVIPKGSLIANSGTPPVTFATDADVTINAPANAVQTITLSAQPTAGSFALSVQDSFGQTLTTAAMPFNVQPSQTRAAWSNAPQSGTYALSLAGQSTGNLDYTATAAQVQTAINALPGYSNVMVAGSVADGFSIVFAAGYIPMVTATGSAAPQVVNCLQANLAALYDQDEDVSPFTDVGVGSIFNGFTVTFGAFAPQSGQPSSGSAAQPLIQVASSTLTNGNVATNITVLDTIQGQPACGMGSSTCTVDGPNFVAANSLTVVVNPLTGWTGTTNQLDCITGSLAESDSAALLRAGKLRASQASTSVQSIVERVLLVDGVTAALGFANVTNAAQQVITFGAVPSSGNYQLALGDAVTAALPGTSTAAQVQAAVQALPSYTRATVTGSPAYGFILDFNGSDGGQAQPLAQVLANTTGVAIGAAFGRPPHSLEVVVQGGSNDTVAQAILNSAPAGICCYSSPVLRTTATTTAGSTQMSVASTTGLADGMGVSCFGVAAGTSVSSVSGNTVTLSAPAIGSYSSQAAVFDYTTQVLDSAGNPQLIGFSRPSQIPVFVTVALVTDEYASPGNPQSGKNPSAAWSPGSVGTIVYDLLEVIEGVGIGGLIAARGTNGLDGSFRSVPGLVDYTLSFDVTPNPAQSAPIRMLPAQVPVAEISNVTVSFT